MEYQFNNRTLDQQVFANHLLYVLKRIEIDMLLLPLLR